MNTDTLLERNPRPQSDYERLMDAFVELAARVGSARISVTCDPDTFRALSADMRRPGKPHAVEWTAARGGALVTFKEKREPAVPATYAAEAQRAACLCDLACEPGSFDPRCKHPRHRPE